ncbi:hypothetical protein L6164_019965 [Bauhinia variegata]|uniref:Uncharacterized protein n=1 Tax=Bauhinia variegata TaxID=167791 RepID=A0ACB9MY90_BAUVA|nr:hypothetical protein L6164_019965 [Bauhinia variegata]
MVKVREKCRETEKQIYWTEFTSGRHQFFKIMIGGFRNLLRIPIKFVRHFKVKLSGSVRLRGPSGHVWNVKLARTADDLLFHKGWKNFAQDHSLAAGDFLVFRYIGDSSFGVSIFDETGCEREDAYFVKKHTCCSGNACFLQKKENKFVQVKDQEGEGEQAKDRKPSKGASRSAGKKVRERNLEVGSEYITSKIVGTSYVPRNSNRVDQMMKEKSHEVIELTTSD